MDVQTIDINAVMVDFCKEKREINEKLERKLEPIKDKIKFFCDKYNARYSYSLRWSFSFKNMYNKEAFDDFINYIFDYDKLSNCITNKKLEKLYNKIDAWSKSTFPTTSEYYKYDFNKEKEVFNQMMDFFNFYLELMKLFNSHFDETKKFLCNFEYGDK